MLDLQQGSALLHLNPDLLGQFTGQGLGRGFPSLHLTPRILPLTRLVLSSGALTDEDLVLAIFDDPHSHPDPFLLHIHHSVA